jgi:hypothetical protein
MLRRNTILIGLTTLLGASTAEAIRRHPTGVNVSSQGATTVYITFGELQGQTPAEALWCGELIPAAPDIGMKCDPGTIFGSLPERYDRSRLSADGTVYTDIMSIPPSVARRAYQAARAGANSAFFYVRRFTRPEGPDEYVAVTCRLTGGGARVPFSLVEVALRYSQDTPVLFVRPGEAVSPLQAEIAYNGTGRLKGRWELVLPGQEAPSEQDLLTEATLPPQLRGTQLRYPEVGRFNEFLPPAGRTTLPGPDPKKLPTDVTGRYLILLRIEASEDREADSNLEQAGAGQGVVHSGAVAGFPIRPLRYYVGSAAAALSGVEQLRQVAPEDNATLGPTEPLELRWIGLTQAAEVRIEIEDAEGGQLLAVRLKSKAQSYTAPPFLREKSAGGQIRWRVVALDVDGRPIRETGWRRLRLERP